MTVQITDVDRGWKALLEAVKFGDLLITAGIHASEQRDGGLSTAEVGAFHEYGLGVPQRAWLGPGIDDATPELLDLLEKLHAGPLLDGRLNARQAAQLIGERMQAAAQQRLRDKDPSWAPLSLATKRRKAKSIRGSKREGKGAAQRRAEFIAGDGNPLIDTGNLLQSVRYRVTFPMGGPLL